MKIPEYKSLKENAVQRLAQARDAQKIVLYYAFIVTVVAAVSTGLQYILGNQIAQFGGLRNMGIRSVLSSVSQFLPVIQTGVFLLLDFGYMAAMVRISRGQYTSPKTLKAGVDRFWPLIRLSVLKVLLYSGIVFAGIYLSIGLFLLTPLSDPLLNQLEPLAADVNIASVESLVLDEASQQAILAATRPALVLLVIVLLAIVPPVIYRYRMASYVLYDHPETGAIYALKESRKMMHRNRLSLFKVDLHLWWYYGLHILTMLLAYGDLILSLLGVTLPFSDGVGYFLFYFVSLAFQFAIFYYLKNRVETTYALAYGALRPIPKNDGVVLGNIFQM